MSNTSQAQIKINLPLSIKKSFEKKAHKVGVTMSFYIKHLMLRELEEEYPTFVASKSTERAYRQARKEAREGKLIKVKNTDEYFKNCLGRDRSRTVGKKDDSQLY
jgi:predicted DNA-binding protein